MAETYGAQLNVRMGSELKERGDAGLASIGFTASQAVRALWEVAASGARGLMAIRDLLESTDASPMSADAIDADDPLLEGQRLYYDALAGLGLEPVRIASGVSDKELLKDALIERLEEKGLA